MEKRIDVLEAALGLLQVVENETLESQQTLLRVLEGRGGGKEGGGRGREGGRGEREGGRREGGEGGKEGGERGREGGRGKEGVTALIFKFGHTEVGTYTHSTVPL